MTMKDFREKVGLTQDELAQKLGITKNYLWMIESGKRNMSKLLQEKFDAFVLNYDSVNHCQSNIRGDAYNVIGNAHSHVNIGANAPASTDAQTDLAVVPAEALSEHLEVVQDNNELLQNIQAQQKRDHQLKKEQSEQLNNILEFVQGLDSVMQTRVREVIDERTRTIINTANHHIHSQALVMLTAIEGIISMVEADCGSKEVFLKQLNNVRAQLRELANYK